MTHADTFAARLRDLRQRAALTVAQLAARVKLDRRTLYKLEAGEREPMWETVQALADALGVDVGAFRADSAE